MRQHGGRGTLTTAAGAVEGGSRFFQNSKIHLGRRGLGLRLDKEPLAVVCLAANSMQVRQQHGNARQINRCSSRRRGRGRLDELQQPGQLVCDVPAGKYVPSWQLLCLYAIQVVAAASHSVRWDTLGWQPGTHQPLACFFWLTAFAFALGASEIAIWNAGQAALQRGRRAEEGGRGGSGWQRLG